MSHEKAIGGPALACKDRRLELGYDVRAMGGTIRDLIHDFLAIAGVSMKIIIYDCQPQAPTWLLTGKYSQTGVSHLTKTDLGIRTLGKRRVRWVGSGPLEKIATACGCTRAIRGIVYLPIYNSTLISPSPSTLLPATAEPV